MKIVKTKLLMLLLLSLLAISGKADVYWTGANPGYWDVAANWDTVALPTSADNTYVSSGTAVVRTDGATTRDLQVTNGNLEIGADLDVTNYFSLANATNATGSVTQTGGDFHAKRFYLARQIGSVVQYNMSGGTLAVDESFYLGDKGVMVFNQTGGSVSAADSIRGGWNADSGASLDYTISGGSLSVVNNYFGMINGTFRVSGSNIDSIDFWRASFISVPNTTRDITLAIELDAGGVTPITCLESDWVDYGDTSGSRIELTDSTITVDVLSGFDGEIGDTYDIAMSWWIKNTNVELVNLNSNYQFSQQVVDIDYNGQAAQVLRLTVVPEPATMFMFSFGMLAVLKRKK